MRTYLIKRLLLMIPTFFGISLVVFIIITNAPGSPAALRVSQGESGGNISADQVASKETYQIFKKHFHLDKGTLFNNYPWLSKEKVRRRVFQWMSKVPRDSIAASDALSDYGSYSVPHLVSLLEEAREAAPALAGEEAVQNARYRRYLVFMIAQNALHDIEKAERSEGEERTQEEKDLHVANKELSIENALLREMVIPDGSTTGQASRIEEMWVGWLRGFRSLLPPQEEIPPSFFDEAFREASALGSRRKFRAAGGDLGTKIGESGVESLAAWVRSRDDESLPAASEFAAQAFSAAIPLPEDASESELELRKKWLAVLTAEEKKSADEKEEDFSPAVRMKSVRERWKALLEGCEVRFLQTPSEKILTGLFDTRFAHYWRNLLVLDFGNSMQYKGKKVSSLIWGRLKVSVTFALMSFLIAYSVAIPIGVFSAVFKDSIADRAITVILFIMYSMPSFFLAVLLQRLFTVGQPFSWFPIGRFESPDAAGYPVLWAARDIAWHLILPTICLTLGSFAMLSRYMRAGLLEVIRSDYIRTARAKGLSEFVVIFKHAMRNGLIPILTMVGNILPALIGGSVIIEVIFNIPGMGQLIVEAIFARDYNLVMADSLIAGFLVLVGMLVSDILYVLVDPRISFE